MCVAAIGFLPFSTVHGLFCTKYSFFLFQLCRKFNFTTSPIKLHGVPNCNLPCPQMNKYKKSRLPEILRSKKTDISVLPLLFAAASRTAASASTCQYSSAVKGGPIAACCRSVIHSSVRCSEAIFICLSSIPLSIGQPVFFRPSGFLCRISNRLLSSSLLFRIFPAV